MKIGDSPTRDTKKARAEMSVISTKDLEARSADGGCSRRAAVSEIFERKLSDEGTDRNEVKVA